MSLQRLKTALSRAEFTPHTATLGSSLDLAALPEAAQAFIFSTWPEGPTMWDLLLVEPWSAEKMAEYRDLEPNERMAVLACIGFHNHELVHRIDFLSTPFGVAFHGKACLETIGLMLEGAELVAELQRHEPSRPLRDIPPLADKLVVSDGLEALNARVRWFDVLRGAAPKHLQSGWMSDPIPLNVAGAALDPVMVHELMPTLLVPGGEGAYVRPLTVLESRAVALTGLLLLERLGSDAYAAAEVARFLETFYTPREAFPDYRFLLDLFTGMWGSEDLAALVEKNGPQGLVAILKGISVVGWYGLHATPETSSEAPLNASPMLRVVVAMQDLASHLEKGGKAIEAISFLDGIDDSERAVELGLTGSRETLSYCVAYLAQLRRQNQQTNPHAALRDHFESILSLQQELMERRFEHGYQFAPGLPDDGAVLAGLAAPEADERLFFAEEGPSEEVRRWFGLREMLLFRHARPPDFWSELWSVLGTHPEAPELPPDAARELALARARFVSGGIWPINGLLKEGADGKRILFVPVRRSALPKAFTAVAGGGELTVDTAWTLYSAVGDPLALLRVGFDESGEEVRILFSLARHRPALEAVVDAQHLVLISDDAYSALLRKEQHPEILSFPVAASSEVLMGFLEESGDFEYARYEQGWSAKVPGSEEELLEWAVEAYGWRSEGESALFFAELKDQPPDLRLTLEGFSHPSFSRCLTVVGPSVDVQRFREERISGTGAAVHPLSEAEAQQLIRAGHREALEALVESGQVPFQLAELQPNEIRLD